MKRTTIDELMDCLSPQQLEFINSQEPRRIAMMCPRMSGRHQARAAMLRYRGIRKQMFRRWLCEAVMEER